MPSVANVATPPIAVAVAFPTTVAPLLTVIVTTSVALLTVFPVASRIATAGCVVNAAPLAAPAAKAVNASRLAIPAVNGMSAVAAVSPFAVKVSA